MSGISNKICDTCFKSAKTMPTCGRCRCIWYCSKECQRAGWETHKPKCKEVAVVDKANSEITQKLTMVAVSGFKIMYKDVIRQHAQEYRNAHGRFPPIMANLFFVSENPWVIVSERMTAGQVNEKMAEGDHERIAKEFVQFAREGGVQCIVESAECFPGLMEELKKIKSVAGDAKTYEKIRAIGELAMAKFYADASAGAGVAHTRANTNTSTSANNGASACKTSTIRIPVLTITFLKKNFNNLELDALVLQTI